MSLRFLDAKRKIQIGDCYAASARETLYGISPHLASMQGATRFNAWNAAYKAGVITCRSALHVLEKLDGARSPFLKEAIALSYTKWKKSEQVEYPFFLMEQERNSLLKEGRSTFFVEEFDEFLNEPRLLVGTNFTTGSMVVRRFGQWVLAEIFEIEESAYWSRRAERAVRKSALRRK